MENGSEYNLSELHMECHTGTHVDAPGHFNQAHFAAGLDVDTLDLEVLNGPALLVDVQRHTNITGSVSRFSFPSMKLHLLRHFIDESPFQLANFLSYDVMRLIKRAMGDVGISLILCCIQILVHKNQEFCSGLVYMNSLPIELAPFGFQQKN